MTLLDSATWGGKILLGSWTEGGAGHSDVVEPATGDVLGTIGLADVADVHRAAALAARAQRDWAARPGSERAAVLRRAGDIWEREAAAIQEWIVREAGSIGAKAAVETAAAAGICHQAAALTHLPQGDVLASDEPHWSFARRRPVGVVTVIAPFNFPLILAIRSVAPALALGNAVLLKPDPRTAVSGGVAIARVFEEAGLPEGLLHVLPGGADVGAATVTAPEVSVVSFTGSTAAGREVGALAGRHLKRAHLELGGNNAIVVLPGADPVAASSAGAFGSFFHQGQICMATGRHLVHRSVAEAYTEALAARAERLPVGDPFRDEVAIGPIIDRRQLDRIDALVRSAVDAGARVVAGGQTRGAAYAPTVLSDLDAQNPAWTDEVFGPVAPIRVFDDLDEAVRIITESPYGLSVGILGEVGLAMQLADRIPSGKVHINEQTIADEPNAPFGGMGDSGNGSRFGGASVNLDAFTELQWLTVRPDIAPYPF